MTDDQMLTTRDVAASLKVSVKKVRQLIAGNALDAIDVDPRGGRPTYRVEPSALADFKRRQRLVPEPTGRRRQRQRAMATYEFIK